MCYFTTYASICNPVSSAFCGRREYCQICWMATDLTNQHRLKRGFNHHVGKCCDLSFCASTPVVDLAFPRGGSANIWFLPAATKLCLGNIFTSVCLSTGGCLSQCILGYTPNNRSRQSPRSIPPKSPHPPKSRPPRAEPPCIWSMSGRYASQWNAFLCRVFLRPQIEIKIPPSDWDEEYSQHVNQCYPMENVNIYIDKRVIYHNKEIDKLSKPLTISTLI